MSFKVYHMFNNTRCCSQIVVAQTLMGGAEVRSFSSSLKMRGQVLEASALVHITCHAGNLYETSATNWPCQNFSRTLENFRAFKKVSSFMGLNLRRMHGHLSHSSFTTWLLVQQEEPGVKGGWWGNFKNVMLQEKMLWSVVAVPSIFPPDPYLFGQDIIGPSDSWDCLVSLSKVPRLGLCFYNECFWVKYSWSQRSALFALFSSENGSLCSWTSF